MIIRVTRLNMKVMMLKPSYTVRVTTNLGIRWLRLLKIFLKACGYALPGKLVFEIEETEDEVLND